MAVVHEFEYGYLYKRRRRLYDPRRLYWILEQSTHETEMARAVDEGNLDCYPCRWASVGLSLSGPAGGALLVTLEANLLAHQINDVRPVIRKGRVVIRRA
jgi:hypothetical protein